ncbi:hypothetical protein RclHR1_00320023 [Rhizophagus clarus]|uniref:Uncharacterized protein n=1 Tax=Rhizophagus clarus TaxID=94130 RepID=A0A2Z6S2U3_9GLOM|nr:hypothetical protein RclHR1_00320023 [Rhizophagus clarus]
MILLSKHTFRSSKTLHSQYVYLPSVSVISYSFEISGILALIKTCREPLLYLTYLSWTCTYQVFQNLSII